MQTRPRITRITRIDFKLRLSPATHVVISRRLCVKKFVAQIHLTKRDLPELAFVVRW